MVNKIITLLKYIMMCVIILSSTFTCMIGMEYFLLIDNKEWSVLITKSIENDTQIYLVAMIIITSISSMLASMKLILDNKKEEN